MTASIVVLSVHGSVASGTSRIHMLWFNESSSPDTKVQTGVHKSGDQEHIKLVIIMLQEVGVSSDDVIYSLSKVNNG